MLDSNLGISDFIAQTQAPNLSAPKWGSLVSKEERTGVSFVLFLSLPLPAPPSQRSHYRGGPGACQVGASFTLSQQESNSDLSGRLGGPEQRTPLVTSQLPAWGDSGYHPSNDFANFIPFISIKGSAEKWAGNAGWCLILIPFLFWPILPWTLFRSNLWSGPMGSKFWPQLLPSPPTTLRFRKAGLSLIY